MGQVGWTSWARCQPSIPVLFWKDRAGIRVPVWALLHAASAAPQLTTQSQLAPLCTTLLSACGAHPHNTQMGGDGLRQEAVQVLMQPPI